DRRQRRKHFRPWRPARPDLRLDERDARELHVDGHLARPGHGRGPIRRLEDPRRPEGPHDHRPHAAASSIAWLNPAIGDTALSLRTALVTYIELRSNRDSRPSSPMYPLSTQVPASLTVAEESGFCAGQRSWGDEACTGEPGGRRGGEPSAGSGSGPGYRPRGEHRAGRRADRGPHVAVADARARPRSCSSRPTRTPHATAPTWSTPPPTCWWSSRRRS